jgi:hypothetical protein
MRCRVLLVVRGRGGSEDFTPEAMVGRGDVGFAGQAILSAGRGLKFTGLGG